MPAGNFLIFVLTIVVITSIIDPVIEELQKEVKQKKPFGSLEEAAFVSVQLTSESLKAGTTHLFKDKDLTGSQYNVLRILRGAGKEGLCGREIGDRMMTKDSDITRMLDRLEARGLISRERQAEDRRYVQAFITEEGLGLLAELDTPVLELHKSQLGHMTGSELESLIALLGKARRKNR